MIDIKKKQDETLFLLLKLICSFWWMINQEAVMNLWERVSKLLETELHLDTSEILVPSQNVIWKVQMHR